MAARTTVWTREGGRRTRRSAAAIGGDDEGIPGRFADGWICWMDEMDGWRTADGGWWMGWNGWTGGLMDGMDSVSEFGWRWWPRVLSAEWMSDGGPGQRTNRRAADPRWHLGRRHWGKETLGAGETHCSVSWIALQQVSGVSRSRSVLGWRHTTETRQERPRAGPAGPSSHRRLAQSGQGRQGTRKGERRVGRLYGTRPAG